MNSIVANPKDFTSLNCWKKCREVKLLVYKKYYHDYLKKKNITWIAKFVEPVPVLLQTLQRGMDHIISCFDLGYIKEELIQKLIIEIEDATKLLNGFIRYTKQRKESNHEGSSND